MRVLRTDISRRDGFEEHRKEAASHRERDCAMGAESVSGQPFQPLFDFDAKLPPATQQKIAEGMQQADDNANPQWKATWDACVLAAARRLPELTSDDVLEEFEKLGHAPGTHNLSAIGPAMIRAMRNGFIKPTEQFVRSERVEKRGNLHKKWLSNYFKKAE
jgi:hypothetical protein